jgi:hypothetical protein
LISFSSGTVLSEIPFGERYCVKEIHSILVLDFWKSKEINGLYLPCWQQFYVNERSSICIQALHPSAPARAKTAVISWQ